MDIFGIKKTQAKAENTIDNINNFVNESRDALKRTEDLANKAVRDARVHVETLTAEARQRLDQSQQEIRERMKIYERKAEKAAKIVTTCEIIKTAACLLGAIGIGWLCIKK